MKTNSFQRVDLVEIASIEEMTSIKGMALTFGAALDPAMATN